MASLATKQADQDKKVKETKAKATLAPRRFVKYEHNDVDSEKAKKQTLLALTHQMAAEQRQEKIKKKREKKKPINKKDATSQEKEKTKEAQLELEDEMDGMMIADLEPQHDKDKKEKKDEKSFFDEINSDMVEWGQMKLGDLIRHLDLLSIPVSLLNVDQQKKRCLNLLFHLCHATTASNRPDSKEIVRTLMNLPKNIYDLLEFSLPNIMCISKALATPSSSPSMAFVFNEPHSEHRHRAAALLLILIDNCLNETMNLINTTNPALLKSIVRLIESMFNSKSLTDENVGYVIEILHRLVDSSPNAKNNLLLQARTPVTFTSALLSLSNAPLADKFSVSMTDDEEKATGQISRVRKMTLNLFKSLSCTTNEQMMLLLIESGLLSKIKKVLLNSAESKELIEPCLFILSNALSGTAHHALMTVTNDKLIQCVFNHINPDNLSTTSEVLWVLAKLTQRFDDDLLVSYLTEPLIIQIASAMFMILKWSFPIVAQQKDLFEAVCLGLYVLLINCPIIRHKLEQQKTLTSVSHGNVDMSMVPYLEHLLHAYSTMIASHEDERKGNSRRKKLLVKNKNGASKVSEHIDTIHLMINNIQKIHQCFLMS